MPKKMRRWLLLLLLSVSVSGCLTPGVRTMPRLNHSERLIQHPHWTNAAAMFPELIQEYHHTINYLEYVIESGSY